MLIFVILIRHINTKLLKSCSRLLKLEKVALNAKSCSKVAEHNLSRPTILLKTAVLKVSRKKINPCQLSMLRTLVSLK